MKSLLLCLSLLLSTAARAETRDFDWLEFIPADELKAMQDAPIVDHSGEPVAPDYSSATPVQAMNGAEGRLPGYIVPVTITEDNRISEFFVVPYFVACIHVPPPPPNQIVFAKPDEPIEMTEIWAAYWVYGTVRVSQTKNAVAESYYSMDVAKVEPWE